MASVRKVLMPASPDRKEQERSTPKNRNFLTDEDMAVKRRKLQCSVSESRSGDSDRDSLNTTDQGTSTSSARTAPLVSTYRTATSNDEVSKELQAAVLQDLLECNDDTDAHLQDWVDCEAESDLSFDIHAAASPGRMEKHRTAKQFEKLPVHVLQASAPNATFRKASKFLAHRAMK